MSKADIILDGVSFIDEIFKYKHRKNIFGTLLTGIGLTISGVGIAVLMNKQDDMALNDQQIEEETE